MAFLDVLEPSEGVTLLEQRRAILVKRLAEFDAAPVHKGSMQLVLEHQRHYLRGEVAWLDEVIERLRVVDGVG